MQTSRPRNRAPSVADVMHRRFVSASPEEALPEVRQTMRLARLRHLVIVDGDRLVGMVSYRDLLESLLDGRRHAESVSATMTPSPDFVRPTTPIAEAAERICRYGFGCLPVVDEGPPEPHIVGLVTETDLLRAAFRR